MQRPSSDLRERARNCGDIALGQAGRRARSGLGINKEGGRCCWRGYGVGVKLVRSGGGAHGPLLLLLTLPFPNKTWFHISLPVSPLPFSIAMVFITHDISFPARLPKPTATTNLQHTHSNVCPRLETRSSLPAHPESQPSEDPVCPPVSLCCLCWCSVHPTFCSWRNRFEWRQKGNKTSFPPPRLPKQNHFLLPT